MDSVGKVTPHSLRQKERRGVLTSGKYPHLPEHQTGKYLRTPANQKKRLSILAERNKESDRTRKVRAGKLRSAQKEGTKTSRYPGVFWNRGKNRWTAAISYQAKNYTRSFLPTSDGEQQAAMQYQEWKERVEAGQHPYSTAKEIS